MIYRSGVIISYIISVILFITRFLGLSSKSIEIGNMLKIGKKYNWIGDLYYSDNKYESNRETPIKSLLKLLLFPLLSWIWVIITVYVFFKGKSEKNNLPNNINEAIKEAEYKLKHTELSKREVICLQNKMTKLLGKDFENEYILELGDDRSEYITIKKDTFIREHEMYSDCSSHNKNVSQYKIEGIKIFERTVGDWREFSGYEKGDNGEYQNKEEITYYVKDGISTDEYRIGESVEDRKKGTEWHELINMKIIPYILYNYDDLTDNDFKNYIRESIKNIDECWKKVEEFYKKNGIGYEKNIATKCNEGEELYFIDTYNKFRNKKKEEEKFYKDLEKITKKYDCVGGDFGILRKKLIKGKMEPRILETYRKFLEDDVDGYRNIVTK